MTSLNEMNSGHQAEYSLVPFFESSPDFLCIAGFDGYFKMVNPALCKLLGYTKEELLSKPVNEFIYPDDRKLTSKHRDNIWEGKPLLNYENRYVSKQGKVIWFSWNSMPKKDEKLVYAIAKNITYIKKHEEERNQLLTELSKTNNKLKQLSYTNSHDLRAPISNLLAIFQLMDISHVQDPETRELIELLETSAQNLKKTLDKYVDDLKNEDTHIINLVEIDLMEVINSLKLSLDSLIYDSNATFHINLDDFKSVRFNTAYLESIFLNLITNSIKYAHPNRAPVITIKAEKQDGWKKVIFSDNGSGFDSEKQKNKVFGLNQTFHNHSDSKGIGLYLVHNHMTGLGGKITVESKVNEGTVFTLFFRD